VKVFADTSYLLALVDSGDEAHERAIAARRLGFSEVFLTDAVILELGAALSKPADRGVFLALIAAIKAETAFRVKPITGSLMQRALDLFASRMEKAWSLADCISFAVMGDEEITDALTTDRHFVQAGFRALLLAD
jgi:uncharacterized protein